MSGNQSAQNWASWHIDIKVLRDIVVVIYKKWVLFVMGHSGSTSSLLREKKVYI